MIYYMKKNSIAKYLIILALAIPGMTLGQTGFPGVSEDCNVQKNYHFQNEAVYKISTSMKTGEALNMMMNMYFADSAAIMGMTMSSDENPMLNGTRTIVNMKDSNLIILMEFGGMKKGMCMDLNSAMGKKEIEKQKAKAPDFTKFKKTGKTRKIIGYNCEEYTYSDKNTDMAVWISTEIKDFQSGFGGFGGGQSGVVMPTGMDGMALAFNQFDKETNMRVESEVTELKLKSNHTISTEGYGFK